MTVIIIKRYRGSMCVGTPGKPLMLLGYFRTTIHVTFCAVFYKSLAIKQINVMFAFDVIVTEHEKLYKILNREEVDVNKYERLFHSYYPKFILDVNAREITQRLLSSKILQ